VIKTTRKAPIVGATAFLLVAGSVLLSAGPASATTVAIHGTQWEDTQVFWSAGRNNAYVHNGMSISPYSDITCSTATLLVGVRYNVKVGSASYGKTGTMSLGQSSAVKNLNGYYQMPQGTFYLTTYLGPSGGCVDTEPTWYATLIYSVSN